MKKKSIRKKESRKNELKNIFADAQFGVRIDLGCGGRKQEGFIGVDLRPLKGVDIVQDLEEFPWKEIPDACASLVMASHLVEHINPAKFGFVKFMDEVWRILKPGGQFMISNPRAGTEGFYQDPTHINNVTEVTWKYFDPLDPSGLYTIYRPKPWKVQFCAYHMDGNMETVLVKRIIDKSYGHEG